MIDPLTLLQTEYNTVCQRVKPCDGEYTFLTTRRDDGSPHVEFSNGEYQYIVTERGLELERRSTADLNEILYWMIYDLTFWMGVEYEFRNRVEGPDVRRVIFAHQLELMNRADTGMATRLKLHIADTLAKNPYMDAE